MRAGEDRREFVGGCVLGDGDDVGVHYFAGKPSSHLRWGVCGFCRDQPLPQGRFVRAERRECLGQFHCRVARPPYDPLKATAVSGACQGRAEYAAQRFGVVVGQVTGRGNVCGCSQTEADEFHDSRITPDDRPAVDMTVVEAGGVRGGECFGRLGNEFYRRVGGQQTTFVQFRSCPSPIPSR